MSNNLFFYLFISAFINLETYAAEQPSVTKEEPRHTLAAYKSSLEEEVGEQNVTSQANLINPKLASHIIEKLTRENEQQKETIAYLEECLNRNKEKLRGIALHSESAIEKVTLNKAAEYSKLRQKTEENQQENELLLQQAIATNESIFEELRKRDAFIIDLLKAPLGLEENNVEQPLEFSDILQRIQELKDKGEQLVVQTIVSQTVEEKV